MGDYCAKNRIFAVALPGKGWCDILQEAHKAYHQAPMNLDNSSNMESGIRQALSPSVGIYIPVYTTLGREPFSIQDSRQSRADRG